MGVFAITEAIVDPAVAMRILATISRLERESVARALPQLQLFVAFVDWVSLIGGRQRWRTLCLAGATMCGFHEMAGATFCA